MSKLAWAQVPSLPSECFRRSGTRLPARWALSGRHMQFLPQCAFFWAQFSSTATPECLIGVAEPYQRGLVAWFLVSRGRRVAHRSCNSRGRGCQSSIIAFIMHLATPECPFFQLSHLEGHSGVAFDDLCLRVPFLGGGTLPERPSCRGWWASGLS
jgi:hypothetical protein